MGEKSRHFSREFKRDAVQLGHRERDAGRQGYGT
jgi:transposase-like protein